MSEDYVLLKDSDDCMERIVFRLTNGVGSPVTSDANCWMLVVNDLCKQAVITGKMVLKTSGDQHRDFIPISTVCEIVSNLIVMGGEKIGNGLYNIGSGKSTSVLKMAEKIIKRYNSNHIFNERIKRLEATNIIYKNKSSLFLKNKKILLYLNFLLILKKIFNIKN